MPLHLIIQYCNDPRPARQAEYDECLRRNLANPRIAMVHNLVEAHTTVPVEFKSHVKYREHALSRWMTYRDAFEFASKNLAGQIVCLANLDIFLDDKCNWDATGAWLDSGIVLCQSRLEFEPGNPPYKDPGFNEWAYATSQDAWVFRAPMKIAASDFEVGSLGCDNAIAERFKRAGKVPLNVADRYPIYHFDRVRGKHSANQDQVHAAERLQRPRPDRHPEREGQYFVPNMDQVGSVDALLNFLKVADIDRYRVICDVISRFVRIGK
jgi:hypothetical protein